MALVSGTVTLAVAMQDNPQVSATRLSAYVIPIQPAQAPGSVIWSNGPLANQVSKCAEVSATATAAVVDTDLTTVVCTDGTIGLSHVRIILFYNDALAAAPTAVLLLGLGSTAFTPYLSGTTPTLTVEPGACIALTKPNGAAGWVVDGTHKIFRVDPAAATVPFRVLFFGD
jgi:hypothetical protein